MTASKSSRARNARTGAQAGPAKGGTAVKNGSAARSGGASRNGSANPNGTVTKDDGRDQARAAVARNGAARA